MTLKQDVVNFRNAMRKICAGIAIIGFIAIVMRYLGYGTPYLMPFEFFFVFTYSFVTLYVMLHVLCGGENE